ncbi:hypothetical protein [Microvirga sp. VF16]|uniref:hypothetical protein n=1 Tax=Microvirga sp. VF16 TaxID=2807101 RepID=UPI00193EAF56|nr:hypothetical protein [Microvirga sp. VF16]QRM29349.1 hypothetical protein JO965_24825 [Microvirga sp. VF16]
MNRASVRPRIFLSVVQVLLGLIFLVWLPAIDHANSETSFLGQLEETLLLTEGEETDRETCPDEWSDGEGSPDALIPSGISCRSLSSVAGQGARDGLRKLVYSNPLGSLRATGPPSL